MIVLFLAYYLAQSTIGDAGPIPSLLEPRDDSTSDPQLNERSLYSILWSCISTISLCTWVAVHPNVVVKPDEPNAHWSKKLIGDPLEALLYHKLPLFFVALLMPEYILAFAMRQRIQAHKIKKQVDGWTITHGFFMVMGGFHLYSLPKEASLPLGSSSKFVLPSRTQRREDEIPLHPLEMSAVPIEVLQSIAPTEKELQDKGKSDGLTKFLVLLQVIWFAARCFFRVDQGLSLAHLEVVTLAYAMVNLFTSIAWWDKPYNVECPIRVYQLATADVETKVRWWRRFLQWWATPGWWSKLRSWLITPIMGYILGTQDSSVDLHKRTSVPMFWSGRMEKEALPTATLGPATLGVAFGAIYCAAWNFEFPQNGERLLWRLSCLVMIFVSLIVAICAAVWVIAFRINIRILSALITRFTAAFMFPFSILVTVAVWPYMLARVVTLVIAFHTLWSLPPGALGEVDWTAYIPHVR